MHNSHQDQGLPPAFCWSRFGTEAGEPIEEIFARKEVERLSNDGVFLWGIGNSVAPGLAELLRLCEQPEVLFSPIRARPRPVDVSPAATFAWTAGEGLDGNRYEVPEAIRVTSGSSCPDEAPRSHYALVCSTDEPLSISDFGRVTFQELRNLVSGRNLGASQVTAVVKQAEEPSQQDGTDYVVALRATLVPPYFVRLREAEPVAGGFALAA
jgi:hypothetical protein